MSAINPTTEDRGLYNVPGPDSTRYARTVGLRKPTRLRKPESMGCLMCTILGLLLGVITAAAVWWIRLK
jgi:hypothetical protein